MYQLHKLTYTIKTSKDGKQFVQVGSQYIDRAPIASLEELFTVVPKEYAGEKNIFYTLAEHERGHRSKRAWKSQEIIPFDLDGIDVTKLDEYAQIACDAIGIKKEDVTLVSTGNGLHILVRVDVITSPTFIDDNKNNYRFTYDKIEKALVERGLPITRDTTAWDYARIFRLPNTINEKYKEDDKGVLRPVQKECKLLQFSDKINKLPFDYASDENTATSSMPAGSFGTPDKVTILNECLFFKWLKECPNEVHEPHAYAMLSITSHFPDNDETGKALYASFNSPSINAKPFEQFNKQANEASGPRTCSGIQNIWGKCKTCPHYKKITSPIQLKSKDFISTAEMGFSTRVGKTIIRDYRGLAQFMSNELKFKVTSETNEVYVFNGTHYEKVSDSFIKKYAELKFSEPVKEKERVEFLNQVRVTNLLSGEDEYNFVNGQNVNGFINFKNCVLNVESGELLPHGENFHFHYCLPYDYNKNATCPAWDSFIYQVTLGREDLINILHEYLGYCLAGGSYEYHKALILSGGGKNGKSTFVTTLRNLVGEFNASNVSISSIATNPFMLAELQNKLVNISEEEPPSCFRETGIFKNITGNNKVIAQRKFKPPFSMLSKAKLIITYNEIPFINDTTTGMRRRLLVVPFDLDLEDNPDKVDVHIQKKLNKELSGIFNRALEGYRRLISNGGFTESKTVNSAVSEIMESNPFYLWLTEEIELTGDELDQIACKDLYEHYLEYAKSVSNGFGVYSLKKFGQEMKKKKVENKIIKRSGHVKRYYMGIKFIGSSKVSAKF